MHNYDIQVTVLLSSIYKRFYDCSEFIVVLFFLGGGGVMSE